VGRNAVTLLVVLLAQDNKNMAAGSTNDAIGADTRIAAQIDGFNTSGILKYNWIIKASTATERSVNM